MGNMFRFLAFLSSTGVLCLANAQSNAELSLEQAIELARKNNGTVRSAFFDYEAARQRTKQSFSSYFPSLTPQYEYSSSRFKNNTGSLTDPVNSTTRSSSIVASWRLWDSGARDTAHRRNLRSESARMYGATQTLRETLFSVQQQYFDALRANELLRVQDAQVKRAQETLKFTLLGIELKYLAAKDRLQAEADLANAEVAFLTAQNRSATTVASLKATIGWSSNENLPDLKKVDAPAEFEKLDALNDVIAFGLKNRADLNSQRQSVDASKLSLELAKKDTFAQWSLDANYTKQFSKENADNRNLIFQISMPLFDAGASQAAMREARSSYESSRSLLIQAERVARAEIESAYKVLEQDTLRVKAAKKALDAAQLNERAAVAAFREGAEGTSLITVLTAQVTLVTAESNYIEAVYDYYISQVRLKLQAGRGLPGE